MHSDLDALEALYRDERVVAYVCECLCHGQQRPG